MSDAILSQADHVINKLGGISAAARVLGHRNPTTVQGWRERGFIPASRHAEVLSKAKAAGIALAAEDFVLHLRATEASAGGVARVA